MWIQNSVRCCECSRQRDMFIIKYSSKKGYDNAKTVYIRVADTKLNQHKIIINKSREFFFSYFQQTFQAKGGSKTFSFRTTGLNKRPSPLGSSGGIQTVQVPRTVNVPQTVPRNTNQQQNVSLLG